LSSDAGLDEAKKAIELGILTYEELAYWVSKGFGYYDIITQLAARNENNAQALLESWNTA
jgi:hypothetical protein